MIEKLLDEPHWDELILFTRKNLGDKKLYVSKSLSREFRRGKKERDISELTHVLMNASLVEMGKVTYINPVDPKTVLEAKSQVSKRRFWSHKIVEKLLIREMPRLREDFLENIERNARLICESLDCYKVKTREDSKEINQLVDNLKKETNLQILYSVNENLHGELGKNVKKYSFDINKIIKNVPLSDENMIRTVTIVAQKARHD